MLLILIISLQNENFGVLSKEAFAKKSQLGYEMV
jgi:hypothetical protein